MKNLINYQDHSNKINEEMESVYDKYVKDSQAEEFDHFNKLVVPKMKSAGFKRQIDPNVDKTSYGAGYFYYPDHSTGVNLFLDKPFSGGWKYVVYMAPNKDVKEFKWNLNGPTTEKCANDAVAYAISLKDKMK
jgi:hypothetical protein